MNAVFQTTDCQLCNNWVYDPKRTVLTILFTCALFLAWLQSTCPPPFLLADNEPLGLFLGGWKGLPHLDTRQVWLDAFVPAEKAWVKILCLVKHNTQNMHNWPEVWAGLECRVNRVDNQYKIAVPIRWE